VEASAVTDERPTGETLAELIETRRGRRYYADLAKESGVLTTSRWARLGKGEETKTGNPSAPIDPETVHAMADVLAVPPDRVWAAIGRTRGVHLVGDDSDPALIARLRGYPTHVLNARAVDAVVDIVAALCAAQMPAEENVTPLRRVARRATGGESKGARGSTRTTPKP
jgi:hypothetical protein